MFDGATERMGNQDPRRKASIEHSKAAERKSNYHQSQEVRAQTSSSSTLRTLTWRSGAAYPEPKRCVDIFLPVHFDIIFLEAQVSKDDPVVLFWGLQRFVLFMYQQVSSENLQLFTAFSPSQPVSSD